jgi:hypothetical protein
MELRFWTDPETDLPHIHLTSKAKRAFRRRQRRRTP